MKRLLCLSLLALSMSGFSQSSYMNRPAIGFPHVEDQYGKEVSASSVGINQAIRVVFPVYNNSFSQVIKAGSGSMEIDLGTAGAGMLELVDQPSSAVFSWGAPFIRDGHTFIAGRLTGDLSPNYEGTQSFVVRSGVVVNTSLGAHWADSQASTDRRADRFTEIRIQVVSRR